MLDKEQWIAALISAFLTLLALMPVGYVLYRNLPPRIATVDLQKLVEEDQQRVVDKVARGGPVSEEQRALMQVLTVDFAKKMSNAVEALSQECHCVLINKSALLNGSPVDYTAWVRKKVQQ